MEGCKEEGIPAFGTLWDFVRTSHTDFILQPLIFASDSNWLGLTGTLRIHVFIHAILYLEQKGERSTSLR